MATRQYDNRISVVNTIPLSVSLVSRTSGVSGLNLATGALRGEGAPKVRRIRSPRSLPAAACSTKSPDKLGRLLLLSLNAYGSRSPKVITEEENPVRLVSPQSGFPQSVPVSGRRRKYIHCITPPALTNCFFKYLSGPL